MHSSGISIWFFIGVLLTVYGALILGYGVFELATGTRNVSFGQSARAGVVGRDDAGARHFFTAYVSGPAAEN